MRILLYEYLTGGGLWTETHEPVRSIRCLPEGRAMVEAVGDDLRRIAGGGVGRVSAMRGCPTLATRHRSRGDLQRRRTSSSQLATWSRRVDGVTADCPGVWRSPAGASPVDRAARRPLLSPDSAFVELATHKTRTAERLAAAGVPVPQALLLRAGRTGSRRFPAARRAEAERWSRMPGNAFVAGRTAGAATAGPLPRGTTRGGVLCRPAGQRHWLCAAPRRRLLLPPCSQHVFPMDGISIISVADIRSAAASWSPRLPTRTRGVRGAATHLRICRRGLDSG